MPHIPAMNEVVRQSSGHEPVYPEEPDSKQYIILYPEDYEGHGMDVAVNVALLVDKEQAQEVKRLAEIAIEAIEEREDDDD